MAGCTLCSVSDNGYSIEFESSNDQQEIVDLLDASQEAKWSHHGTQKVWIDEQTVNRYSDYWSEYLQPNEWRMRAASRDIHGVVVENEALGWQDVLRRVPTLSISSLISDGAIKMMSQPIVDVSSGVAEVVAYEMLARGYDISGKMIPPAEMFAHAKEQGRMFVLDKECRINAVKTAADLPGNPKIFVNFVPTSIYNPEHCLQTTMAATSKAGIEPERIVFEVVETEAVRDIGHLKRIFDYYKKHSVLCALDDVGAGFNNIEMLEVLEPNVFKLDRSIADGIANDRAKRTTALRLLKTANSVGTIALGEGIERLDDAICLAELGYHWQQGYLYGRPSFEPTALNVSHLYMPLAA